MIDTIDRQILSILRANCCTARAEVARRVGLTPTAVFERIRKLEERGVITGYRSELDPEALGLGLLAFVFITTERPSDSEHLGPSLAEVCGVEEVHVIAGEDCFLLKIRAADTEALYRLLQEGIGTLPGVRGIRTTIVLETIAERSATPFGDPGADEGDLPTPVLAMDGDAPPPSLGSVVSRRAKESA